MAITIVSASVTVTASYTNTSSYTSAAGTIDAIFGSVNIAEVDHSPVKVSVAGLSTTTSSASYTSNIFSSLSGGAMSVAVFITGTVGAIGPQTPNPTISVTDCYVTVGYSDGSTAIVRPSAATFVDQGGAAPDFGGIVSGLTINPPACTIARPNYGPFISCNYVLFTGFVFPNWLIVNEPSIGLTDRTGYLFYGQGAQHSWNQASRQRGQATYTLISDPNDSTSAPASYVPTIRSPIYLWDHNSTSWFLEFAGRIIDYKIRQIGNGSAHYIDVTVSSLEIVFDDIYAEPVQYVNQNVGFIVTDLYNRFVGASSGVTLGTIQSGPTIPLFNAQLGDKISALYNQLATTAQFTWNVSPIGQLFFGLPSTVAAPFSITSGQALWDTASLKLNGADYRNRQAVKISPTAIGPAMEFFVGAGQQTITLRNPVAQVTNAYATLSTCNTATGTFSGQPAPGDTLTIGPASGAWQAGHIYALGGIIIVNGYVQTVTFAGTSGGSIPTFSTVTGQTTTDNTVIWTCQGPAGLATGTDTYTFVQSAPSTLWGAGTAFALNTLIFAGGFIQKATTGGTSGSTYPTFSTTTGATTSDGTVTWTCEGPCLDNTQFGQILIDPNGILANTVQNTVDAINANPAARGTTISLPTWECNQCNAINPTGTSFTLQQKAAGTGWVSQISASSSAFTWQSGAITWSPNTVYPIGSLISEGSFWQQVTFFIVPPGQSGGSAPSWNNTTGGTTSDGTLTWTCRGPAPGAGSSAQTAGGTSPQGSLGPGEGATISLQVYEQGTSTAAPAAVYVKGSNIVTLATPLNVGSNLNIEYTRADAGVIEVEDTQLVTALAAQTYGTGKVQQFTDATTTGLISTSSAAGLQFAQEALAAYNTPPSEFQVELYQPGLLIGQQCTVALSGALALFNGTYFIQEVQADLVTVYPYLDAPSVPGGGHYRYTVRLINIAQIFDYLDFWEGLAGGGSGGGPGAELVPTSGGATPTSASVGNSYPLGVQIKSANYTAVASDASSLIVFEDASPATATTLTLPATAPSNVWQIEVQNAGSIALTIARNGRTIDGVSSDLTLQPGQGVEIRATGSNYATQRGVTGLPLTTKGDLVTYGTGVVRLGVGTDGKVLTANSAATNGIDYEPPLSLTTTGTSGAATLTPGTPYTLNIPQYSGGGGSSTWPGSFFTPPPSIGSLTWVNQGGATATTTGGAIVMTAPASGTANVRALVKAIPARPYTFTVYFATDFIGSNFTNAGICIRDSTSGKLIVFGQGWNGSGLIRADNYSSPTSGTSNIGSQGFFFPIGIWLQIIDDGTNFSFAISATGQQFTNIIAGPISRTAFLANPDQIGIFVDSENSHPVTAIFASWVD